MNTSSRQHMHRSVRGKGSRAKLIGTALAAGALLGAGLLSVPASATTPTTTGTWEFFSPQAFHDSTASVTGPTAYKTAVRPPINADGSSNFSAKRGVIPVQFDLLAAPSTTVTTTRTYDPPVWESIQGISWPDPGYASYATFTPSTSMTFADVVNLSATYSFTQGDCYGGSLRWTINVGADQNVHAYYGTPNGPDQSCSGTTNSGSGQNLITTGITADRFEVQGAGAPVYTTYAAAEALVGAGAHVNWISLILDSGWNATQRADISNVTVNDNTWVPQTSERLNTETVPGAFAKTCVLPDAQIRWAKDDATPTGGINEDYSVQPKDAGVLYRQVDCKYIYNLDVSSLKGVGTYTVWANISGHNVEVPATFDLR